MRAHLITNVNSVMGLCTKDFLTWSQDDTWNWEEKLHTGAMLHEHTGNLLIQNPSCTEIPAVVPVWVSSQTMIKQPLSGLSAALYLFKCNLAYCTQMVSESLIPSWPYLICLWISASSLFHWNWEALRAEDSKTFHLDINISDLFKTVWSI